MHADDALRMLQAGRQRGDRQRRGIGSQNRFRRHNDFELAQQCSLGLEILDDRFDDEPRADAIGQYVDGRDSTACTARSIGRDLSLRRKRIECCRERATRFVGRAETRIEKLHGVARLRSNLRDSGTHCARADHGDDRLLR